MQPSHSCSSEQRPLSFTPTQIKTSSFSLVSHLCTSSPCPSPAGPGSCGWPTAGLWSSSPDWPGPRQQTYTSSAPARSTTARRRTAPQTRTAGRYSPPEQSLLSGPGPSACPCRRGGSPSAQTSASDTRSLSHPVGQSPVTDSFTGSFAQFIAQLLWWNNRVNE